MSNIIQKMIQKIAEIPERSFFNNPASLAEIEEFETELDIKLPESIKTFYLNYNGGFFADSRIKDNYLQDPEEIDWMRWNSNYILSLEDVIAAYYYDGDIPTFDIQEEEKYSGKRFIPILHTSGQELLLLDLTDLTNGIPVIDAFHEVSSQDWKVLYPTFEDLLNDYIQKEGMIETVASYLSK